MSESKNNRRKTTPDRVTIDDVAQLAQVSIKTVSRVLNKEPNVRERTREKVMLAVAQLNYHPSLSARSLAGDRSHLIGLFYENPSANYITDLQEGALRKCRESGYHLIVEPLGDQREVALERVALFQRQLRIDGVILTPPVSDNDEVIAMLQQQNTPFVLIAPERNRDVGSCVFMDDRKAAYDMTKHLLQLGHRAIGFIKGHPNHSATHVRYEGFMQAMREHHLEVPAQFVRQGYFTYRSGMRCAEELLALSSRPTAVFASNDDMAAAVVAIAHKMNIKVPEELSVVGFDDSPVASVIWPQLSTVRQPVVDMAVIASELLINQLSLPRSATHTRPPTQRYLDFELVLRDSTAPPPPHAS